MAAARSRILAAALLLLSACSKPSDGYQLISSAETHSTDGKYVFELNLDDSTLSYSTAVAARVNTAQLEQSSVEFQFQVVSPSGESAIERITFPLAADDRRIKSRRREGSLRDYEWPWREQIHISPAGTGIWTVFISLPDTQQQEAVKGIGLSYKGQGDGKR